MDLKYKQMKSRYKAIKLRYKIIVIYEVVLEFL